jgi:hypothetical protein
MQYLLKEGGYEEWIEAEDLADAREQAREWAEGYGPNEGPQTTWITVHIFSEADDTCLASLTVVLDPEEPECTSPDGHEWIDQGVQGHGGGIISTEACRHCACTKTVVTWATNPATGEQGLTSTRYELAHLHESN